MSKIDGYENNLLLRTRQFGVEVVNLSVILPKNPAGFAIASQLVRSGTSVGANLVEAQDAVSSKEFRHKLSICLREAKETLFWLEIIRDTNLIESDKVELALKESEELVKILISIVKKLHAKSD